MTAIAISTILTDREKEVLKCLANGDTSKQAAPKLGISHRTVEAHKDNIYKKTKLRGIGQLIRLAIQLGLTTAEIKS